MTTILAIDTATGPCSVAVWYKGHIAAYVENVKPVMQSVSLLPMIEDTLVQSGISYGDLSAVTCTIGPGSFTGIRVGLATARGIVFATGIPGIGITTLDVLTASARPYATANQPILAILNAGKGEYYYQLQGASALLGTLESSLAAAGNTALVVGNATINAPVTFPRADALALLAATQHGYTRHALSPFYIRNPDAKLPVKNV